MDTSRLNIAVIADGPPIERAEHWTAMLSPEHEVHVYSLKNWIGQPYGDGFFLEKLQKAEVLVLNWDAINGDPDFGSDRVLTWVHYRSTYLLDWVADGGLLIVEGQTRLAVPQQEVYDALLGRNELRVCGPEDPHNPKRQVQRIGPYGRVTGSVRKLCPDAFAPILDELDSSNVKRSYDDMFPGNAAKVVPPWLEHHMWNALYRGWFRWNPLRGTRYVWTVVARTDRRRHNHPIMLVAPHGSKGGGVFVTTMLLASSEQKLFVQGILSCAQRVNKCFPIKRWWQKAAAQSHRLLPVLAALIIALGLVGTTQRWQGVLQAVLVVAFLVAGVIIAVALPRMRRYIRDLRGL